MKKAVIIESVFFCAHPILIIVYQLLKLFFFGLLRCEKAVYGCGYLHFYAFVLFRAACLQYLTTDLSTAYA